MTQKLSRYAAKVRQGICPSRYGALSACPAISGADAHRYQTEAMHRAMDRNGWRKPLVRIVRHWGIVGGERRMLPLTVEQLRLTR